MEWVILPFLLAVLLGVYRWMAGHWPWQQNDRDRRYR